MEDQEQQELKLFNAIDFLLADRERHGDIETAPAATKHRQAMKEFVEAVTRPRREVKEAAAGAGKPGDSSAANPAGTSGGQK